MEGKEFDEAPLAKVFSSQEEADADAAIRKFEGVYGILNEDNTITPMTDEQIAQYSEAASCAINLTLGCNNRDYRTTDGTEGYEYFTIEAQEELYAIGDPEATIDMYVTQKIVQHADDAFIHKFILLPTGNIYVETGSWIWLENLDVTKGSPCYDTAYFGACKHSGEKLDRDDYDTIFKYCVGRENGETSELKMWITLEENEYRVYTAAVEKWDEGGDISVIAEEGGM